MTFTQFRVYKPYVFGYIVILVIRWFYYRNSLTYNHVISIVHIVLVCRIMMNNDTCINLRPKTVQASIGDNLTEQQVRFHADQLGYPN